MRAIQLLALSLRKLTYIKSRCVVFFLMSVFVPSLICAYWVIALRENPSLSSVFTPPKLVSYYVTVVLCNAFLVSHLKEYIMEYDIQQGRLAGYLIKPYSYYWLNIIISEFPYRLIQGVYGLTIIGAVLLLMPNLYVLHPQMLPLVVVSGIMGYFICANVEMMLGLLALWVYDMRLMHNAYDVLFLIFSGINVPLYFFPSFLEQIAYFTPFPSMIYTPTVLATGQVTDERAIMLLASQVVWLAVTSLGYIVTWRSGIRRFTAAGI